MINRKRFRSPCALLLAIMMLFCSFSGSIVSANETAPSDSGDAGTSSVTSATYSRIEIASNALIVAPGSTQTLTLTGYDFGGNPTTLANSQAVWTADASIGTVSASGVLTTAAVAGRFAYGYVHATYDGLTADYLVLVGNNVAAVFEDFESLVKNGKTVLSADRLPSGSAVGATVSSVDRSAVPVLYGSHAGKLAYDLTTGPETGTKAVYVSTRDMTTGSLDRVIPGTPTKIGVWVYGDQGNHWLRARLRNSANTSFTVDFTSSSGFNWNGWKFVTADITGQTGPFKFMDLYLVETNSLKYTKGAVYFDQLSVFYGQTTTFGLDLRGLAPMQVGDTRTAFAYITKKDSTAPEQATNGVTYLSSRPDIAAVDANGKVTALQAGKTSIVALYADAQPAVFDLTVSDAKPPVQSIQLFGPSTMEITRSADVQLMAQFASNTGFLDVTKDSDAVYSSSNPSVAAIDSNVKLKAISPGTATISVAYGGQNASFQLTVTPPIPVLAGIQLVNMKSLTAGDTFQANVNAIYNVLDQPQSPVPLTQGVSYQSSMPAIAGITSSGQITANSLGVTVITATYGGKTSNYSLVVNTSQASVSPKREMRAAWISSVENIDWPKKGVTNAAQQRQDFKDTLDQLAMNGINTVIVQIRPTSDALYPSQLNPWSEWLTGVAGKDPGYDPLAFMIEEAHKRNIEFHAWFNPYRVRNDQDTSKLADNSPAKLHPEWVIAYGGKLGYNPGIPAVKQYVIDSVMEVVKKYDIDGVHFDDYFYPYPVEGVNYPDSNEYAQYGGTMSLADWRRNNVDTLIQSLSAQIKQEKPYVQFGISPFGIWRNKSSFSGGSDTSGLQSYDAIYADTLKWVQMGWLDYITPQLYWYINYGPAAYDKLVNWWKDQVSGKPINLYTGNGVYKVGDGSDANWLDPEQIPNQIRYNRNFANVKGTMFFSASVFLSNPLNVTNNLKNGLFKYPALPPQMSWLDSIAPNAVQRLIVSSASSGVELNWRDAGEDTKSYIIYRAAGEHAPNIEDPATIIQIVSKQPGVGQSFIDRGAVSGETYTYIVTAADRLHNESEASDSLTLQYVQPTDPGTDPGTGPGTNPTSGPTTPSVPQVSTVQSVDASELRALTVDGGQATMKLKADVDTVQLPANASSTIGSGNDLVLRFNEISAVIPAAVLSAIEQSTAGKSPDAKLVFSALPVKGEQLEALVDKGEHAQGAQLKAAAMYNFNLSTLSGDGTKEGINTFGTPISLTFVLPEGIDASKAGVYFIAEDGTMQYIKGQLSEDKRSMTADVSHFSAYGVLELSKLYADVPASHWAYPAVDDLSRKLIVHGVDDHSYSPERSVTRAEFAALLVRAFGLSNGAAAVPFQDVKASDWFAGEVAAAYKLGVVTGVTADRFDPNSPVNREQMAVMLVRATALLQGKPAESAAVKDFADMANVHDWAQSAVRQAAQLGLVTGREGGLFAPASELTRAESAQVIYNAMKLWP
ncbi:family 10 glycosylhydrolase [Paenibacillus ferrarius]|uniref:family 10 glycosylhydrolase n=1 Tax=Paenibacillus ferrarius TaxID=1469647 RepID=UPI003D28FECC